MEKIKNPTNFMIHKLINATTQNLEVFAERFNDVPRFKKIFLARMRPRHKYVGYKGFYADPELPLKEIIDIAEQVVRKTAKRKRESPQGKYMLFKNSGYKGLKSYRVNGQKVTFNIM